MTATRNLFTSFFIATALNLTAAFAAPDIPPQLEEWQEWALWKQEHKQCPTPYNSGEEHLCFWPSSLELKTDSETGSWTMQVTCYAETWVPLPGDADLWPINVGTDTNKLVVVDRNGHPATRLPEGVHQISGEFAWDDMPQKIHVPQTIGMLTLTRNGEAVPLPNWDKDGHLWLKRLRTEATAEDQLAVQIYRVLEDGIPMWLHSEVELSVSGKSREEELGWILPEGWTLAEVKSPIPVAIEDDGFLKAQVRAGKWIVQLHAFRTTNLTECKFSDTATPTTDRELIGFQAKPDFRTVEVEGMAAIDVTQTTFPERWRQFPVYRWETDTPFQLIEKMRGMGEQQAGNFSIQRDLWLDERGERITFRDRIQGHRPSMWRLDVAEGQSLGAVREGDKGQLITANPDTGTHGVEVRSRTLDLTAVGTMNRARDMHAIGWQSDVDSLNTTFHLPPGWRMFALFGADWVRGDWLTNWTLLDLFLLLIFSLAVCKLWGPVAGTIALFRIRAVLSRTIRTALGMALFADAACTATCDTGGSPSFSGQDLEISRHCHPCRMARAVHRRPDSKRDVPAIGETWGSVPVKRFS